jgi:hypothetical protein
MTETTIAGFILLVFGGLIVTRPDMFMRFHIWAQRAIMGAVYEPSRRTYKILRGLGAVLVLLGLLVITGVIG